MKATAFTSVVASIFCVFLATVALAGVNTWTTSGPFAGSVAGLVVDPTTGTTVYASVYSLQSGAGGVFKSISAGSTWGPGLLTDQTVTALAVGPPGTVYAGTVSAAVFKSVDGGATWSQIVPAHAQLATGLLKVNPVTPTTVYRSRVLPIVVGGNITGELLRSTDGGTNWVRIDSQLGNEAVSGFAIHPQSLNVLYVAKSSGFFRSTDVGTTWSLLGNPLPSQASLAIDPMTPSTIYAGTLFGVFKSVNGGSTFTKVSAGLPNAFVTDLVIDPLNPSRLYLGMAGNGVFRTTDSGASWTALNDGLTNLNVTRLAIDHTGIFLHAGTRGSGVFDFQIDPSGGGPCSAGPTALCLNSSRFRVEVNWRVPSQGTSGVGQAMPMTSDTGSFWFFDSANIELVVKVLDGRRVNGKFWVFSGALSDVEYVVTVTDMQTGTVKTYFNPQGRIASVANTEAF